MPAGYGHNSFGINIQNLRSLASDSVLCKNNNKLLPGGLRTDCSWTRKVEKLRQDAEPRGQLSSTVNQDNSDFQESAQVKSNVNACKADAASQKKLASAHALAQGLQHALSAVDHELGGLSRTQQRLSSMLGHLKQKASINQSRQQVRSDPRARQLPCDEVSGALVQQEQLLGKLVQRLQQGWASVAVNIGKLTSCRQELSKTLKDKVAGLQVIRLSHAVELDSKTPAASSDTRVVAASTASAGATNASGNGPYICRMQQQTICLIEKAQQLVAGANRLRKATRQLLQEAQTSSHEISQKLDGCMVAKLNHTEQSRIEFNNQLNKVQDERTKAVSQRESLRKGLQDKMIHFQQLQAACNICLGRPDAEAVADILSSNVRSALAAEAAQQSGVSVQLAQSIDAADAQVAHLDELSAALVRNIADHDAAMTLEEKVALLDGRRYPAVPPTPSVLSVCSSVVSGYSCLGDSASQISSRVCTPAYRPATAAPHSTAGTSRKLRGTRAGGGSSVASAAPGCSVTSSTMMRVAALEQELLEAKMQTQQLQKTIAQLKLGGSRPRSSYGSL